MEYFKHKLKDKSAQDMIEFTFVLPLLLYCFVFVLTGGQMVYNKFAAFEAVFNGTRQASIEVTAVEGKKTMQKVVDSYNDQTIAVAKTEVFLTGKNGNLVWKRNQTIIGEVVYTINTLFPINFVNYGSYGNLKVANQAKVVAKTAALVEYDDNNEYVGSKN